MSPLRREYAADASALLWRVFGVVAVIAVVLIAGLVILGVVQHPSVSPDPVLRHATGYGQFIGETDTALIFELRCATSTTPPAHLAPGAYQVSLAHLHITEVVARVGGRAPVVQSVSVRSFLQDTHPGQFRGYVVEGRTGLITDAPGESGCAGPITGADTLR